MARLIWSENARENLRSVRRFIARDSPRAATRVAAQITQSVRRLRMFPTSGRIVPELGDPALREVIAGSYRVIYHFAEDTDVVEVLLVVHGSRLLPPLLTEE